MSASKGFYDLLFEVSNEHRHGVLLLRERAMRITDLAREMDLNNPEIRRHISRLREVGLIRRDVEGYYSLTPYGETSLLLLGSSISFRRTASTSGHTLRLGSPRGL